MKNKQNPEEHHYLLHLESLNWFSWWHQIKSGYHAFLSIFEKYVLIFVIGFFLAGIFLAKRYAGFGEAIVGGFDAFIEGYGVIAPIAIFLILAPTLTKIFSSKKGSKFGFYAFKWLAKRKFLATVWGAVFTVLVFRFSILPETSGTSIGAAALNTLGALGKMLITSSYFYAIYAAIIVSIIALKVKWLHNILEKAVKIIEHIGEYFEVVVPLFMMAVGGYVVSLPALVKEELATGAKGFSLQQFSVFGITFDPTTAGGMIAIYVAGGLLVALGCFIWHGTLLAIVKLKVKQFSIKEYFSKYWIKVYPLLWATSSEALSTPLNLYLTKKHAPWVRKTVRRFMIGAGSLMNINGTIICVYVLAGVVGAMLGLQFSLWQLLLTTPLIFLLSYGVPGIPGELVIFAGPLAILLGIPEAILPVFLSLYVGLQLGLPDSFRTGNNSTDDYLNAIAMNEIYEKKFKGEDEEDELIDGKVGGERK